MSGQNIVENNETANTPQLPNDPDALTDQELEWVVGGTDPEFAQSQFEQLQKPAEPPVAAS